MGTARKGRHRFRGPGGRPRTTKSIECLHGGDPEGRRTAGTVGSTAMAVWRPSKNRRLNGDNYMGGLKGGCVSEEEYSSYSEVENSVRKGDVGRPVVPAPSTADATVARQAVTSSIAADVAVGEAEVAVT